MASFATATDLANFMRQAVDTAQANEALANATAAIKNYTRQAIELVTNDAVVLRGVWSQELFLPERPVVAVHSITIKNGSIFQTDLNLVVNTDYRWDRRGLLRRVSYVTGRLLAPASGYWGGDMAYVEVNYDHGFAAIPGDVRGVCLSVAAREYSNPTGILRERTSNYDVMYGRTSAAQLVEEEQDQLNVYRRRVSSEAAGR